MWLCNVKFTLLGFILFWLFAFGTISNSTFASKSVNQSNVLKADRVVVLKSKRRMFLMKENFVLKIYVIALGRYPKGPKRYKGDAKTPEGNYILDYKIKDSDFYRAIRINYPNARDIDNARTAGKAPGGKIVIHGLPNTMTAERVGHPVLDWTQGCIAVTNKQMDEIWKLVDAGTPIEIHP